MISVNCRKLLAVLLILVVPIQSYGFEGVNNHWVVDDCDQVREAIRRTVNKCLHNIHPWMSVTDTSLLTRASWLSPKEKRTAKKCIKLKSITNEELIPWCNANIAKCRQNMQAAEAQGQRLINAPMSFRLYPRSPGFEAQCTELDPAGGLQRIVRKNEQLAEEKFKGTVAEGALGGSEALDAYTDTSKSYQEPEETDRIAFIKERCIIIAASSTTKGNYAEMGWFIEELPGSITKQQTICNSDNGGVLDLWGAVALGRDDNETYYTYAGYTNNSFSSETAIDGAMEQCSANGKNCKVQVVFSSSADENADEAKHLAERLARLKAEEQGQDDGSSIFLGTLLGGAAAYTLGGDEGLDAYTSILGGAISSATNSINSSSGYSSGNTAGSSNANCVHIARTLANDLEALANNSSYGICLLARGQKQALIKARRGMVANNCATSAELQQWDQSIRDTQATASAACDNSPIVNDEPFIGLSGEQPKQPKLRQTRIGLSGEECPLPEVSQYYCVSGSGVCSCGTQ